MQGDDKTTQLELFAENFVETSGGVLAPVGLGELMAEQSDFSSGLIRCLSNTSVREFKGLEYNGEYRLDHLKWMMHDNPTGYYEVLGLESSSRIVLINPGYPPPANRLFSLHIRIRDKGLQTGLQILRQKGNVFSKCKAIMIQEPFEIEWNYLPLGAGEGSFKIEDLDALKGFLKEMI
jgi:hypothetical protein